MAYAYFMDGLEDDGKKCLEILEHSPDPEIRKLAKGQCIILNRTPIINVLRKKPAIEWIIFFSFNWEKIIEGIKIKEKINWILANYLFQMNKGAI